MTLGRPLRRPDLLRASADPGRIFRVTYELARQVRRVGVRRMLDSAPLEDAVTTQDTVTVIRGAIRGLLRACPPPLAAKVRGLLRREDDYTTPGEPACDWQDRAAAPVVCRARFEGRPAVDAVFQPHQARAPQEGEPVFEAVSTP